MAGKVSRFAEELADREAIRDCLFRYCRGIDRLDTDLLHAVYWPDSIDEHTGFHGSGDAFIDHAVRALGPLDQTMHKLGNILIEIEGDAAHVESYFDAFHRIPLEDGSRRDFLVGGRYLDRFEKRDDEWRIQSRFVIIDWFRYFEDSADWTNLPLGVETRPGERKPADRSYTLMRAG